MQRSCRVKRRIESQLRLGHHDVGGTRTLVGSKKTNHPREPFGGLGKPSFRELRERSGEFTLRICGECLLRMQGRGPGERHETRDQKHQAVHLNLTRHVEWISTRSRS